MPPDNDIFSESFDNFHQASVAAMNGAESASRQPCHPRIPPQTDIWSGTAESMWGRAFCTTAQLCAGTPSQWGNCTTTRRRVHQSGHFGGIYGHHERLSCIHALDRAGVYRSWLLEPFRWCCSACL